MTTTKPEEAKGKAEDVFQATGVDNVDALFQERLHQLSQPFICPFCGKTECKSLWHLVKLSTLPRSYLRPKHFFLLYGLLFIVIIFTLGIYLLFRN
jgi:hypothetical protein